MSISPNKIKGATHSRPFAVREVAFPVLSRVIPRCLSVIGRRFRAIGRTLPTTCEAVRGFSPHGLCYNMGMAEAIVLLLFIIGGFAILKSVLRSPQSKGKVGEKIVASRLRRQLPDSYFLINDIYLPLEDGTTTQIDHIVISEFGIFVIETKNYSGWIFASEKSRAWTQTIYHEKNTFQNPIRQNFLHICTLSKRLNIPRSYFISVVAFTGDCDFKTERPAGVVYSRETAGYILSFAKPLIKGRQVQEIADAILKWNETVTDEMRAAHVDNLHEKHRPKSFADSSTPICPRCGAPMILRHRKSDGGAFYGCSKYPNCRGIVNVE